MEDPARQIPSVVQLFTSTDSPDVQKDALERYMTPDVGFRHPVCYVKPGKGSREQVVGIYQCVVQGPIATIDITVDSVVFDASQNVLYLEARQKFRLFWLPIRPVPARLVIRLTLRKVDGLYYISQQEDFYHPEDFAALLLPISAPFVRAGLVAGTVLSNILYRGASFLGYWRPTPQGSVQEVELEPSEAEELYKDE